jgi:hypothetical protein
MKTHTKAILIFSATAALGISCSSLADNGDCNGGANPRLMVGTHHLSLNKIKKLCIHPGGVIKIKLDFKNALPDAVKNDIANLLHADEKEGSGIDIVAEDHSYDADDRIWTIQVDPDAEVGAEGEFWIEVDGIGILDPRVKIIPLEVFIQMLNDAINNVLIDEFGMTIDEVNEFQTSYKGQSSEK